MPRISRNTEFYHLTGGINNVDSIGVINQSPRRTESPDMVNVEYYQNGGIKTMEGNIPFGNQQSIAITGGFEYRKGNDKYCVISTADGNLKLYNGVTNEFDTVYTFPSATAARCSFVNYNNGVVVTNGIDDLVFFEYGRNYQLQGTVSGVEGSDLVTGNNTMFGIVTNIGDYISIDGNTYLIKEVDVDADTATVSPELLTTFTDISFNITEVSLCNAYLVNSEDPNLHEPIRGLPLQVFKGRLFVGSGDKLYYSEVGRYNAWDVQYGAGVIAGAYNDTSDIKGLGLSFSYMFIHKDTYSYILTGGDLPSSWSLSPHGPISCGSQQSFIAYSTNYYVYDQKQVGIYPLAQMTMFNDKYIGEEISKKIKNTLLNIPPEQTANIFSVVHPRKKYIMFYVPTYNNLGSNTALIWDLQTKSWLRRAVPQNVTIAFRYNDNIYIGTEDGLVLREFTGNNFNGEPIMAYWKSPWFDVTSPILQKSTEEFTILHGGDKTNVYSINVYRDGNSSSRTREMSVTYTDIRALIWDDVQHNPNNLTMWNIYYWVKSGMTAKRFPIENQFFRQLQIEFSTRNLGEGFAIFGFGFNRIAAEEAPW